MRPKQTIRLDVPYTLDEYKSVKYHQRQAAIGRGAQSFFFIGARKARAGGDRPAAYTGMGAAVVSGRYATVNAKRKGRVQNKALRRAVATHPDLQRYSNVALTSYGLLDRPMVTWGSHPSASARVKPNFYYRTRKGKRHRVRKGRR